MSSEFFVQELPHHRPVPGSRMVEIGVQREIAIVVHSRFKFLCFVPVNGQIKNRQVEETDFFRMPHREFERLSSFLQSLRRGSKQQINIRRNARLFEVLQGERHDAKINPFVFTVEYSLIS